MAANTADKVRALTEPFAEELGLRIWDVRYVKEGASWFLRIFIDRDDGVTIEDCENFSRAIDQPLDDADLISDSYYLEVSSPGLGRELTRPEHFAALCGEEVTVRLFRPRDGEKEFVGILQSMENDNINILSGTELLSFSKQEVSKVRLNDDKDI